MEECAALFGSADKGVKALNSLSFTIDSNVENAAVKGSTVLVNPDGQMMTPDEGYTTFTLVQEVDGQEKITALDLNGLDARAFAQAHETGHKAKVFGNTDNDGGNKVNGYKNHWKIWNSCFRNHPTRRWTFEDAVPMKNRP